MRTRLNENEELKIECEECSDKIPEHLCIEHDDEFYCTGCFEDNFAMCRNCDDHVHIEDMSEDIDDNLFCSDCFSNLNSCDECNERFMSHRMGSYVSPFDSFCSRECLNEDHIICERCDDMVHNDDARYHDSHDEHYCDDCYRDMNFDEMFFTGSRYGSMYLTDKTEKLDTKGYTIGVEIEANNPEVNDLREFTTTDREQELLSRVDVKEDESLNEDGFEIAFTPTNNDYTYEMVKVITKLLQKSSCDVDVRCGLHIHLGGRKLEDSVNRHKVMIAYSIFKETIFAMLPPSRRDNTFCGINSFHLRTSIMKKQIRDNPEGYFSDISNRYCYLNFDSYWKHHTLEVRCHSGSINKEKIINWININTQLFDFAISSSYADLMKLKGTMKEFKELVLCDDNLIKYYDSRKKKFGNKLSRKYKKVSDVLLENISDEFRIVNDHLQKKRKNGRDVFVIKRASKVEEYIDSFAKEIPDHYAKEEFVLAE